MRLTIPVDLPKRELEISYDTKMMFLGSCFAENIGKRLVACKFPVMLNPFGIIYNPQSIAMALQRIIVGEYLNEFSSELVFHGEYWHSMLHHGDFSRREKNDLLTVVNETIGQAHAMVRELDVLMLTFGTAYVYKRKCDGLVVGNCHKIPGSEFVRSLLTVDEAVAAIAPILETMRKLNPKIKFLFTVSPIRHLRDGAHGNQISKSVLLLAVEELMHCFPDNTFYFPAYEIVLDELRDYRFYSEDMIHPSSVAIAHIWESFRTAYFGDVTNRIVMQIEALKRDLAHRPFDVTSRAYVDFKQKLMLKIEEMEKKYPFFDFSNEIEQCRTQ